MRAAPLLLLAPISLAVWACGDPNEATQRALADARGDAADGGLIDCAVGGGEFVRACTIERVADPDGTLLVLRHSDGGFRRLRIVGDGRGVIAADGADPARVTIAGDGGIEVAIAADRYRLPATVKGAAAPR